MTYNTTMGCDSGKASGKKWGISSTILSPLKKTTPVLRSGIQAPRYFKGYFRWPLSLKDIIGLSITAFAINENT
jgi:hypothetical protein